MKRLFEIDLKDYQETDDIFKRPSARAIILNEQKRIALVYSEKEKYYKFPGGGIRENENHQATLIREVKEEVGLIIIPNTIREFGSVMRRQKGKNNTIFEQENFYYICQVEPQITLQNLDDYEKEARFVLKDVALDEAIKINQEYHSDNFFDEIMIKRETKVLQIIKEWLSEEHQ